MDIPPKNINGINTQMLRKVQNISWDAYVTSKELYGALPCLSEIFKRRRLALAGRASNHNELAGKVLFWTLKEPRRVGRPNTTLKNVLKDDIGLEVTELQKAVLNRVSWWKKYAMSP